MDILPQQPSGAAALLSDLITARRAGQLGDLLILAYDAGVSTGMGLPLERHPDATIAALIQQTIDGWQREIRAEREYRDTNAKAPDWLQTLQEAAYGDR